MTINDLDLVEVCKDIPAYNLKAGMRGTVIHIFTKPTLAYEVEFNNDFGEATAQVPLLPNQLIKLENMTREQYIKEGRSRHSFLSSKK